MMETKKTTMNTIEASILIWHYYSKKDWPVGTMGSKSRSMAYQTLKLKGLLEGTDANGNRAITKKGIALVTYWLETPLPKMIDIWVIDRND